MWKLSPQDSKNSKWVTPVCSRITARLEKQGGKPQQFYLENV